MVQRLQTWISRVANAWRAMRDGPSTVWRAAVVSAVLAMAVTLREIGLLLTKIDVSGQSFGPGVLTGIKLDFWDVAELQNAVGHGSTEGVWETAGPLAATLLRTHLAVDLLFALGLALVLAWSLSAVSSVHGSELEDPKHRWVRTMPIVYLLADWAETATTWIVASVGWPIGADNDLEINAVMAGVVHALSDVKWLFLMANVIAIAVLFFRPSVSGDASWSTLRDQAQRRGRGDQVSVGPPGGVVAVVAVFVVLVALPGGGPLDQFPDVLRVQFDHFRAFVEDPKGNLTHLAGPLVSVVALGLFAVLVYLVVASSVRPTSPKDSSTGSIVGGAIALSLGLMIARWIVENNPPWESPGMMLPTIAPVVVVALLALLAWFVDKVRAFRVVDQPAVVEGIPTEPAEDAVTESVGAQAAIGQVRRTGFPALVVTAVVFAASIGGVRALLPIVLVRENRVTVALPAGSTSPVVESALTYWLVAGLCLFGSYVVAVAGSAMVMTYVERRLKNLADRDTGSQRSMPHPLNVAWCAYVGAVYGAFILAGVVLAVSPGQASLLGATGATTTALGVMVVVFAALGGLTRHRRWPHLSKLGGYRTSWTAVVVAIWMMASQLDIHGGYHDARTVAVPDEEEQIDNRTLDEALDAWFEQAAANEGCLRNGGRLPMVLVAAPGGGGRAMYWTVAGMDELFTSDPNRFCPSSLFAASGVSGGAVGLTTRLSVLPGDRALSEADAMAAEDPLAATIAALVLRDIPQPFTGIRSGWSDRAAVLEQQWAEAAAAFEPAVPDVSDETQSQDALGEKLFTEVGSGWWAEGDQDGPVLLLNGTSVGDGCRVIVASIDQFSGVRDGCLDAPNASSSSGRSAAIYSASTDGLTDLGAGTGHGSTQEGKPPDTACEVTDHQSVYASTAALLAARFPYVTPSGAIRTCAPANEDTKERDVEATTYVVDGGYLENTGLLTLTQTWMAVADKVETCNRLGTQFNALDPKDESSPIRAAFMTSSCPRTTGDEAVLVEPWLVMLENHYGSAAAPRTSPRIKELFVPPSTAFGKKAVTTSTTALEQAAVAEITRDVGGTGACNRFIRLSPGSEPGVEAPLGWVLSYASKISLLASLDRSLDKSIGENAITTAAGRCS